MKNTEMLSGEKGSLEERREGRRREERGEEGMVEGGNLNIFKLISFELN